MKRHRTDRLDPTLLDSREIEMIERFLATVDSPVFINEDGKRVPLPEPVSRQLKRIVKMMMTGRAIVILPEEKSLTSQAAANHLGVSRQHLVDLLETGDIPFHRVGTHRRVLLKDLLKYESSRDGRRTEKLVKLMTEVDEAGLYDASFTGEDR